MIYFWKYPVSHSTQTYQHKSYIVVFTRRYFCSFLKTRYRIPNNSRLRRTTILYSYPRLSNDLCIHVAHVIKHTDTPLRSETELMDNLIKGKATFDGVYTSYQIACAMIYRVLSGRGRSYLPLNSYPIQL